MPIIFSSDPIIKSEIFKFKTINEYRVIFISGVHQIYRINLLLEEENYPGITNLDIIMLRYTVENKFRCIKLYPSMAYEILKDPVNVDDDGGRISRIYSQYSEYAPSNVYKTRDKKYMQSFLFYYIPVKMIDKESKIIWMTA